MKKVSLFVFIVFSLIGCSKDDNDYLKSLIFGQGEFVPILPDGELLTLSTTTITYGQVLNGTSRTASITISNTSKYEINVKVNIPSGSDLTTNVNTFKIAKNGTFVLNVLYSPKSVYLLKGILQLSYGSVIHSVNITGNAVAELLTVLNTTQVGTLDFGDILVGKTGKKTITLSNVGTEIAKWSNSQSEFTLNPSVGSIAVGASQNVEVSFTPTNFGLYTNDISIAYNGGTVKIPYRVNRIALTRVIGVSCSSSAFVNVPNNSTAHKTIVISNTGNSDLTVSSITVSQVTSGIYNCAYSGVIPPNQSVNVDISFTPKKINYVYSCSITVQSDKTSGSISLSFTGNGS
ncbi:MAG: choice-of-anchor D domain-containing protein [Mariniphaga sp.]